jgi:hypothetical protein
MRRKNVIPYTKIWFRKFPVVSHTISYRETVPSTQRVHINMAARLAKSAMISIVDEDKSVREAAKMLIRSLGHATATFASAEESLGSGRLCGTACLITESADAGHERSRPARPFGGKWPPHARYLRDGLSGGKRPRAPWTPEHSAS